MKHIREIFLLYPEGVNKNPPAVYRHNVVNKMQTDRQLIVKVCDSLNSYMDKVRAYVKGGCGFKKGLVFFARIFLTCAF